MKNLVFILRVDNTIDLITNSSSELFVIKSTKQKDVVIKMLEKALEDIYDYNIELGERVLKEKEEWEVDYEKTNFLNNFPEEKHAEIEELFSQTNWYSFVIDRDHEYIREIENALIKIGFELIDTDY